MYLGMNMYVNGTRGSASWNENDVRIGGTKRIWFASTDRSRAGLVVELFRAAIAPRKMEKGADKAAWMWWSWMVARANRAQRRERQDEREAQVSRMTRAALKYGFPWRKTLIRRPRGRGD